MATLTTIASIRAHDQLTGPLNAMAAKVNAISGRFASASAHMRKAGSGIGVGAIGGAYGLGMMVEAAKEYQDTLFGVKAAGAAGSLDDIAKGNPAPTFEVLATSTEELHGKLMDLSKELKLMPELFARAAEEATKAGKSVDEAAIYAEAAGLARISDRSLDPGEFTKQLTTYDQLYGDAAALGTTVEKLEKNRANDLALLGALTKTSATGISEGLRNFSGMSALFGSKFEEDAAMVAALVQGGQLEKEAGTALKSLLSRGLNMDRKGAGALTRAGIDRSQYMDFAGVDPNKAANQLATTFKGRLWKGAASDLQAEIARAMKTGEIKDPDYAGNLYAKMRRRGADMTAQTHDDDILSISNAVQRAGGKFNLFDYAKELSKAMAEGRLDPADLGYIGEPRRQHQTGILVKHFELAEKLKQAIEANDGEYLERLLALRKVDPSGTIAGIEAAWRRMSITFSKSGFMVNATEALEKIVDAASGMGPVTTNLTLAGAALLAFGGPALNAVRAVKALGGGLVLLGRAALGMKATTTAIEAATGASTLFGLASQKAGGSRAAAAAMKANAAMLAGMGLQAQTAQRMIAGMSGAAGAGQAAKAAGWLSRIAGGMMKIARFAGPFMLVAGAWELFQNWDTVTGIFDEVARSDSMKRLGTAFTGLWKELSPLGNAMSGMLASTLQLFGFDPKGSTFAGAIEWVVDKFACLIEKVKEAVEWFNRFTGLTSDGQEKPEEGAPSTSAFGGPRGGQGFAPAPVASELTPLEFAPITAELPQPSWVAGLGSQIIDAVRTGMAVANVNVSVNGTGAGATAATRGGKAAAPPPRVSNGQQYNGGN